jgi:hypothetical protein
MCHCFVDATPHSDDCSHKTWGDFLRDLDDGLDANRRVVTAVRFDGVDQPSFRTPELAELGLSSVKRLDVETDEADQVLSSTADTARAGIAVVTQNVREAADTFRGMDVGIANARLVEIADVIKQLTLLTTALTQAAGVNLGSLVCGEMSGTDIVDAVGLQLEQLLTAQEARDWFAVADCLEFELAPALDSWRFVFDAIEGGN